MVIQIWKNVQYNLNLSKVPQFFWNRDNVTSVTSGSPDIESLYYDPPGS